MNVEPLNKNIYNRAVKLGIEKITLRFSGGSDASDPRGSGEGFLDVEVSPPSYSKKNYRLISDIEDWAWQVYSYSGAGDGGDDIEYDLVNKKVSTSEWYTAPQRGDSTNGDLEIAVDDE